MPRETRLGFPLLTLSICIGLSFSMVQPATAGAERVRPSTDGAQVAAAANKADSPATTGSTASASSVVVTLKAEQQQLRRMGEAIKRTKRVAADLLQECTQPVEMMGEIDIIGQDVIPIMPATSEGFGNQVLPPRPKYINLHMAQLDALAPILQDDVNTLVIPDVEKTYAAQPVQDLQGNLSDFTKLYATLKGLTKDKVDYNVQELMSAARGVDSTCKGMDAARKKLLHDEAKLQKQEEQAAKNEAKK